MPKLGQVLFAVLLVSACQGAARPVGVAGGQPGPLVGVSESSGCGQLIASVPAGQASATVIGRGRHTGGPVIRAYGEPATVDQAREAGLFARLPSNAVGGELQLLLVDEVKGRPAGARAYFSASPISADDTVVNFLRDGGVMFMQRDTVGNDYETVRQTIGDYAQLVRVGEFDAALVHADPIAPGFRHYALYWSDGEYDYTIHAGVVDPADAVEVARSIYC